MVLPHGDPEGGREGQRGDDQPAAQLIEVLGERKPVVVTDRTQRRRHGRSGYSWTTRSPSGEPEAVLAPSGVPGAALTSSDVEARDGPAGSSAGSSSSSPRPLREVIESLNSRIPWPSARPAAGRRLGPKISRMIPRTTRSSSGPIEPTKGIAMCLQAVANSLAGRPPPPAAGVDAWR